jgi:hypothetical protein
MAMWAPLDRLRPAECVQLKGTPYWVRKIKWDDSVDVEIWMERPSADYSSWVTSISSPVGVPETWYAFECDESHQTASAALVAAILHVEQMMLRSAHLERVSICDFTWTPGPKRHYTCGQLAKVRQVPGGWSWRVGIGPPSSPVAYGLEALWMASSALERALEWR